MSEKDNVTDLPNKVDAEQTPAEPPTHFAIPVALAARIEEYLRKQPMEDVEMLVGELRGTRQPLALRQPKQPEG